MSDGPHRSLNMRPGWKKVAEFADNEAFAPEDICGAVGPALRRDWRLEVPEAVSKGVGEILGPAQESLFEDDKPSRLEELKVSTARESLSQVFVDCAVKVAAEGNCGSGATVEAASTALLIWGANHARQIEEHYLRKSSAPRARSVRSRTEEGVRRAAGRVLARQLLGLEPDTVPRKPPKRTGLDDGVQL